MTRRQEFTANTRAKAFARDGGRCCICTRKVGIGGEPAEFDHVHAAWESGDNSLDNCRTLCIECHRQNTNRQAGERSSARRHQKKTAGIKRRNKARGFRGWRNFAGDVVWRND